MSQCARPPSVMGGAIRLAALPLVVMQQRMVTWVVCCKENEFKRDCCTSLVIGAKTFSTQPGFERTTSVYKSETLTTRLSWLCNKGVSTL